MTKPSRTRPIETLLACAAFAAVSATATAQVDGSPIVIERQGAFAIGGRVLGDRGRVAALRPRRRGIPDPTGRSLREFVDVAQRERRRMAAPLGRRRRLSEHFRSARLPRVHLGRSAGRACELGLRRDGVRTELGRDQGNFTAWRFGAEYPNWFEGVQFPKDDAEASTRPCARAIKSSTRWRTRSSNPMRRPCSPTDRPDRRADEFGRRFRALLTAMKSDKIIGIVTYENVGYVFPRRRRAGSTPGPFGPVEVPLEDFLKLTRIPMQVVWGDNPTIGPLPAAARGVAALRRARQRARRQGRASAASRRRPYGQHAHSVRGPQQRCGRRPAFEIPARTGPRLARALSARG